MAHLWSEYEPGPERWTFKHCERCGLKVRLVLAGDAETKREVLVDGTWVKPKKQPDCIKRVYKTGKRHPWTEAQRAVFQAPIRKA